MLERQQQQPQANANQANTSKDLNQQRAQMESLLQARERELLNAQKQIDANDSQIQKLQQKLQKLQKQS